MRTPISAVRRATAYAVKPKHTDNHEHQPETAKQREQHQPAARREDAIAEPVVAGADALDEHARTDRLRHLTEAHRKIRGDTEGLSTTTMAVRQSGASRSQAGRKPAESPLRSMFSGPVCLMSPITPRRSRAPVALARRKDCPTAGRPGNIARAADSLITTARSPEA